MLPFEDNFRVNFISIRLKLINYVSLFIIFSGAFFFKTEAFDFYYYYFFILFLLPLLALISGLQLQRGLLITMSVLFVIGLPNVVLGNNALAFLVKQILGISVITIYFYYLLRANDFDWLKLFGIYMNLAKIVAWIAITQTVTYLLGIRFLYDFSYFIPGHQLDTSIGFIRVSSILVEPSHFVIVMTPAIFISVYNIFKRCSHFINKTNSILIALSVFLTFSTLGYLSLIFSFIFLFKNPFSFKKVIGTAFFFVTTIFVLYYTVAPVTSRVDGLVDLFIHKEIQRVNISSFTIFNNFTVASQNFLYHPLFGTGLGSHQVAFDKYAYKDVFDQVKTPYLNSLNKEDANSLFLRLLSETGLLGIITTFLFIGRYRVKASHIHEIGWIVNTAILILFLVKLIRDGHYFNHGLPFFIWIYYLIKKDN